jgi:hypothetical protein
MLANKNHYEIEIGDASGGVQSLNHCCCWLLLCDDAGAQQRSRALLQARDLQVCCMKLPKESETCRTAVA